MNLTVPAFDLTVKNYRPFRDREPLRLRLGAGFTAFVGPNNSGKSTLLKVFYELRTIFDALQFGYRYEDILRNGEVFEPQGVTDPREVFYNGTTRALSVEVEIPDARADQLKRLRISVAQDRAHFWAAELFLGPELKQITRLKFSEAKIEALVEGGDLINADFTPYWQVLRYLTNTLYIGPFRNVGLDGKESHYDLTVGRAFIAEWDDWKTGASKQRNLVIQRVTEDIARIFQYERLEINATADKADLQVVVEGQPYRLRELGAGLAQFIVVFGNAAFKKPSVLLVDEPESHLHPSLQIDFLTSLASYAGQGILYATHSLGLARSTAERIYSLRKSGDHTLVHAFEQTPNYSEFAGAMSFSAFKDMGHDLILLVEGTTEIKAVQQFLRVLRKDHKVVVIPLGGSQLINRDRQQELAELKRLTDNVAVLIDSERSAESSPLAPERDQFLTDCRALGFHTHVTEWRAFENYLTEDAIRAVKGANYRALEPFELLKDTKFGWGKHENWRIAREMSRDDVLATDIGAFLEAL